MAFYIGQRVVCVNDSPGSWGYDGLRLNSIYTVTDYRPPSPALVSPVEVEVHAGIRIAEIPMPGRHWFVASRFRPITERKTDISVFTALLNPSRDEVSA